MTNEEMLQNKEVYRDEILKSNLNLVYKLAHQFLKYRIWDNEFLDDLIGEGYIKLNPQYAKAWYNKGNALVNQGNYDEAIKCYDEAIKLNPQYAKAWYNKGVILQALHRNSEAESAFKKAKELEVE